MSKTKIKIILSALSIPILVFSVWQIIAFAADSPPPEVSSPYDDPPTLDSPETTPPSVDTPYDSGAPDLGSPYDGTTDTTDGSNDPVVTPGGYGSADSTSGGTTDGTDDTEDDGLGMGGTGSSTTETTSPDGEDEGSVDRTTQITPEEELVLSDTGPEVGILLLPSMILGYLYNRKKRK